MYRAQKTLHVKHREMFYAYFLFKSNVSVPASCNTVLGSTRECNGNLLFLLVKVDSASNRLTCASIIFYSAFTRDTKVHFHITYFQIHFLLRPVIYFLKINHLTANFRFIELVGCLSWIGCHFWNVYHSWI